MTVTNPPLNLHKCNNFDTQDRLIAAVLAMWGDSPQDLISVRSITARAAAAASSIDYHFGNLERLYGAAQDRALTAAEEWAAEQLDRMKPFRGRALDLATRVTLIAGIIDDWATFRRSLAMAEKEASAQCRNGGNCEAYQRWNALWRRFWHEAADLLGMGAAADILAMFHDGEGTQHLLAWNRPLDLALLHEDVTALLAFCEEGRALPSPVRLAYREATRALWPGIDDDAAQASPLDKAAAAVLQHRGIGALTFRNVAAAAGETLGRTTWHFGTKPALLERAFTQLYRAAAGPAPPPGAVTGGEMLELVVEAVTSGTQPILRAFDEVIMHIARSPDHAPLRGALRAFRDPAANWTLEMLLELDQPASPALAAAFSSVCRGLDHFSLAHAADPQAAAEMARGVLRRFTGSPAIDRAGKPA